jgi:hypothetical protein
MTGLKLTSSELQIVADLGNQQKYAEMYARYAHFAKQHGGESMWASIASNINGNFGEFGTFAREYMRGYLELKGQELKGQVT